MPRSEEEQNARSSNYRCSFGINFSRLGIGEFLGVRFPWRIRYAQKESAEKALWFGVSGGEILRIPNLYR